MEDSFCVAPFVQACLNTKGETRPCCNYAPSYKPEDHTTGNINTDGGLTNAIQSSGMVKLREQFLKGEKPDLCVKCWKEEEQHGTDWSMRSTYNLRYDAYIKENSKKFTKDFFNLKYLETGFGNFCNLSCKMCLPAVNSTMFSIVNAGKKNKFIEGYLKDISYIDTDITGLDYIKLVGGEPMMERKHDQLLEQLLKEHPNPGNITI